MAETQNYGTGRRKSSAARVFIKPGSGNIVINQRSLEQYFGRETARMVVRQPLQTVDMVEIREEVRRVNAVRGVQLHVIYVGAYGGKDFRKLAEENGGVFVAVGG